MSTRKQLLRAARDFLSEPFREKLARYLYHSVLGVPPLCREMRKTQNATIDDLRGRDMGIGFYPAGKRSLTICIRG
jgi:hypothetical protein